MVLPVGAFWVCWMDLSVPGVGSNGTDIDFDLPSNIGRSRQHSTVMIPMEFNCERGVDITADHVSRPSAPQFRLLKRTA